MKITFVYLLSAIALICLTANGFAVMDSKQSIIDDEFVGPFASWVNVKTECGAAGDGKIDDTHALQKALDIVDPANAKRKVLYIPAGVYRITKTLNVPRTEHAQTIGMGIIGEDPATTRIIWDGPQDGRMFYYSPWYARMMRLTLDGRGPFGCYDMCGNVWQWTESERSDGRTRFCIIRGGSFFSARGSNWYVDGGPRPANFATKFLLMWPGLDRCGTIGFRCVKDIE